MSHFLHAKELRQKTRLGAPRAAVTVLVKGSLMAPILEVQPGVSIAKADAQLAVLPGHVRVVDSEGKDVKPSPGAVFMVSIETIDPFHLVVQVGP